MKLSQPQSRLRSLDVFRGVTSRWADVWNEARVEPLSSGTPCSARPCSMSAASCSTTSPFRCDRFLTFSSRHICSSPASCKSGAKHGCAGSRRHRQPAPRGQQRTVRSSSRGSPSKVHRSRLLWTTSYAVLMAGLASLCMAVCYWIVDVRQWTRPFRPLEILGMNAIAAYVVSMLGVNIAQATYSDQISTKCFSRSRARPTRRSPTPSHGSCAP